MRAAPDLFPPLDDALRALDGFPGRPADVTTARAFLEQLDQVRDVPAVVLDQAQAEHMEGAYLAGVRCADESGHVLVMSLPVFLELCPPPAPARRVSVRDKLRYRVNRPLACLAGILATCSVLALVLDHDARASAWLAFGAAGWTLLAWAMRRHEAPCSCGRYQHADPEQHEPQCSIHNEPFRI